MIEVIRKSDCGLFAKIWHFSDRSYGWLVLDRYREGKRETPRHRFKGPLWDSSDERSYRSQLKRPENIPADVIDEAIAQMQVRVAIGWATEKHLIETRNIVSA